MHRPLMIPCLLVVYASLAANGIAAQEPQIRARNDSDRSPAAQRERPGGHPADEVRNRGNEGVAEGVPSGEAGNADVQVLPPDGLRRRVRPPRYQLGVFAYNTPTGVVVTRVVPGSPASNEGLERGDRIVTVGGYQVGIVGDRVYYLGEELQRQVRPNGTVMLLVHNVRNNRLLPIEADLTGRRRFRPAERRDFLNRPRDRQRFGDGDQPQ